MEDFRRGSPYAFKRIYNQYYAPLRFFAYKMTTSRETAQDIASDVLSKLWTRREHFDSMINIKAFLYITTRNQCLDYLRYTERQKSQKEDLYYSMSNEKEEIIIERIVKAEFFEEIHRAIESLPPKRKLVFTLFYVNGLSIDQIAKKLKMNPNTVSTSKLKAIGQVRNFLFETKLLSIAIIALAIRIVGNIPL